MCHVNGSPCSFSSESTSVILVIFFSFLIVLIVVGFLFYLASNPLKITSDTLPQLVSNFTGRENETEQLVKVLDFSIASPGIVNIVGGPGFGKSALSFAVGRAILKKGIRVHYVNLRQKKDVEAAKIAIVTAVQARKDLTSNWNPKLLEFWAAKCTSRTVLILDNCDDLIDRSRELFLEMITDTVQYTSILKILVTSQLRLHSLETEISNFHLNPLCYKSSFLLLTQMFPTLSAEHAESLVHLSGNVPLALKLVGALLQDGVYPQTLKDELQKHPIRTLSPQDYSTREHLSACIGAAYKRLSETLKHALAVYSHLPGTFDIKAAGGVLNISSSDAEINVVNRLRNRCLIEYDGRSRLEIHRLIAAYVKEADTKFVTSKLFLLNFELNYAQHFSKRLLAAGEAFNDNVASKEGLRNYDADQHNFIHLMELLMTPSATFFSTEFVWTKFNLAVKAANLLRVRVPRQSLIRWHDSSISLIDYILRAFGTKKIDSEVICDMIQNAVDFRYQTRNKTDASLVATKSLHLLEMCDVRKSRRVEMMRMMCFSDVQEAHSNLSLAFQCHQKTSLLLKISEVAASSFTLAETYNKFGFITEAKEFFLHFLEEKKDSSILDMLRKKAQTYIWLFQQQPEIELKLEAVSTLDEYTKHSPGDLFAKGRFARYLYLAKQFNKAELVVRNVIMNYKDVYNDEDIYDLISPLETLGLILKEKGKDSNCDELIAVHNRSYTISLKRIDACPATVCRLKTLAKTIMECKGDEAAVPYYRDIVSMQQTVKGRQHEDVVEALVALAGVLFRSSQYSEFFRVCKQALEFATKLEGEFDMSNFGSSSTNVAVRDESFLSDFFSKSYFPSLNWTKRLIKVISTKKNSGPPLVLLGLMIEVPQLYLLFIFVFAVLVLYFRHICRTVKELFILFN